MGPGSTVLLAVSILPPLFAGDYLVIGAGEEGGLCLRRVGLRLRRLWAEGASATCRG